MNVSNVMYVSSACKYSRKKVHHFIVLLFIYFILLTFHVRIYTSNCEYLKGLQIYKQ